MWCIYKKNFSGYNKNKGADILEIYNNEKDNYISVWMTKEEQQLFDRQELTDLLLSNVKNKKCKVIYFLSGNGDLYSNTEILLTRNLGCA